MLLQRDPTSYYVQLSQPQILTAGVGAKVCSYYEGDVWCMYRNHSRRAPCSCRTMILLFGWGLGWEGSCLDGGGFVLMWDCCHEEERLV